jgi:uncharacterized protein
MISKTLNAQVIERLRNRDFSFALRLIEDRTIPVDHLFKSSESDLRFPLIGPAVDLGEVDVVRRLIELGANVNARHGASVPLINAAGLGHCEIVDLLLNAGADVNAAWDSGEDTGHTALMEAASKGDPEIVRKLLAAGADPKAVTGNGETSLFSASLRGNAEIMELLLEEGSPVTGTCLHRPVEKRQRKIVLKMLAQGPDVNTPFPESAYTFVKGDTPIILAVTKTTVEAMEGRPPFPPPPPRSERLAIIDALLEAGADLSVQRRLGGRTPLLIAVEEKDPEIAARLVRAGADPNAEVMVHGKRVSAMTLAERTHNSDLIAALSGA